mgnify:FL=1
MGQVFGLGLFVLVEVNMADDGIPGVSPEDILAGATPEPAAPAPVAQAAPPVAASPAPTAPPPPAIDPVKFAEMQQRLSEWEPMVKRAQELEPIVSRYQEQERQATLESEIRQEVQELVDSGMDAVRARAYAEKNIGRIRQEHQNLERVTMRAQIEQGRNMAAADLAREHGLDHTGEEELRLAPSLPVMRIWAQRLKTQQARDKRLAELEAMVTKPKPQSFANPTATGGGNEADAIGNELLSGKPVSKERLNKL